MGKPVVFLSHSARDGAILNRLKSFLDERTEGGIAVFLSSDGESIRLGSNWVRELEQALQQAKLMFIFLTPSSLQSSWVYFEAAYAYSRGKTVIPVAILGVDTAQVPPPMNLLQGFNVRTPSQAANIIGVINEVCETSFAESLTEEEFRRIFGTHDLEEGGGLDRYTSIIRTLVFYNTNYFHPVQDFLSTKGIEYEEILQTYMNPPTFIFLTYGLTIDGRSIQVEVALASETFPIVLELLKEHDKNLGPVNYQEEQEELEVINVILEISFQQGLTVLPRLHWPRAVNASPFFDRTELKDGNEVVFNGTTVNLRYSRFQDRVILRIDTSHSFTDGSPLDSRLAELINMLFSTGILSISSQRSWRLNV